MIVILIKHVFFARDIKFGVPQVLAVMKKVEHSVERQYHTKLVTSGLN